MVESKGNTNKRFLFWENAPWNIFSKPIVIYLFTLDRLKIMLKVVKEKEGR